MAKRFVSIWLPHLATDWFELRKPELKKLPFVLVSPSHGRMIITAANTLARKNGVQKGMVLADARAIFPSLQYFDDKPNLEIQLLQRIAEWCIRFTPCAAVDPLGGIILDASGCSHLWGSDEAYLTDITKRLETRGYYAKAAIADTIGAAWAIVRFGKENVLENGKHIETLMSLPPEALRLELNTVERLRKLGLRQIKSFISMPRSSLKRRFGTLIIQRINQALGMEQEFINPVYPVEPYQERLPCIEPISRIEGIEIALQRLLEALCKRLRKEGKGLRTAYFRGYRVDSKTVGIQIATSRASNNVSHLFHLFQMKLSTIEPDLGIELFVLEATKVEDHTPIQEEFWKQKTGLNNNHLSELIDRISAKIGASAIHRYLPDEHYWPERSFKKASSLMEQPSSDWKIDRPRPLKLLASPESIEVTALIPDYPPMLFRHKGKLHKISKADGPERIEQEWWIQDGEHRDYYAVEDEEGCRYWLFRSGHYDDNKKPLWFLHGFFA
jgi:protein ImuB